jgi:hypothetical protein
VPTVSARVPSKIKEFFRVTGKVCPLSVDFPAGDGPQTISPA